jgi:hypothetical protein
MLVLALPDLDDQERYEGGIQGAFTFPCGASGGQHGPSQRLAQNLAMVIKVHCGKCPLRKPRLNCRRARQKNHGLTVRT